MSKYKGLFTFDVDNHRYLPVEQADGIITNMNYRPESEPKEPLIKDEKIRKAVRAWAEASYLRGAIFDFDDGTMILRDEKPRAYISFDGLDFCEFKHITAGYHTIEELCGEEEE